MITLGRLTDQFNKQKRFSYDFFYWLNGEFRVYTELGDDILLACLIENKLVVKPEFLKKLKQ